MTAAVLFPSFPEHEFYSRVEKNTSLEKDSVAWPITERSWMENSEGSHLTSFREVRKVISAPMHVLHVPFCTEKGVRHVALLAKQHFNLSIDYCEHFDFIEKVKAFAEGKSSHQSYAINVVGAHYLAATLVKQAGKVYLFCFDSIGWRNPIDGLENFCFSERNIVIVSNAGKTQTDRQSCSLQALAFAVHSQWELKQMDPSEIDSFIKNDMGYYPMSFMPGSAVQMTEDRTFEKHAVPEIFSGIVTTFGEFTKLHSVIVSYHIHKRAIYRDNSVREVDEIRVREWNSYCYDLGRLVLTEENAG